MTQPIIKFSIDLFVVGNISNFCMFIEFQKATDNTRNTKCATH